MRKTLHPDARLRYRAHMTNSERTATTDGSDPTAMDRSLLVDSEGQSLYGRCSTCHRTVDNHDSAHRVSSIIRGGRGVECAERGDIPWSATMPLGRREADRG